MNRRNFLKFAGMASGGLVATATMAEAGFFADFAAWLKRRPVWSIPKNTGDFLTADKLRLAVESLTTPNIYDKNFLGIIHPMVMYDLAADDLLPEFTDLRLDALATIYYERQALDSLKSNMPFVNSSQKRAVEAEFKVTGQIAAYPNHPKLDFRERMALFTAS